MSVSSRSRFQSIVLVTILVLVSVGHGHAQPANAPASTRNSAEKPDPFGEIDLVVFKDRTEFLDLLEQSFGPKYTGIPDKLPRSPFTVTGHDGNAHLGTCKVFVPENITPDTGNEVFAQLMHNWFGARLSYATSAGLTYRWLIYHEARHCQPDHFGGDILKNHRHELEADLFAHKQLASTANPKALARDIIAFRVITSTLIARQSHMIGLSLQQNLETPDTPPVFSAQQEIRAFLTVRKLVIERAKEITTALNPTNRELVRAIIDLKNEKDQETLNGNETLVKMILIALDKAIAHFSPVLHHSANPIQPN